MASSWNTSFSSAGAIVGVILAESEMTLFLAILLVMVMVMVMLGAGRRGRLKLRLPPGPVRVPIFGNWLQIGNNLDQRSLSALASKYGDIMYLKMGQKDVVVVSSPSLAKEVLVNQGVEFGSRARNLVFDIFAKNGEDMVFCPYGDHWRRMRRIAKISFFTNKVLKESHAAWNEEINAMISDVQQRKEPTTTGIVIRNRLQLLMYNVLYRMMFGKRFESEGDSGFQQLRFLNAERSRLAQSFSYNYADFIPFLRPCATNYLKQCRDVLERRISLFKTCFLDERQNLLNKALDKCGMDYVLEAQRRGEITKDNILYMIENLNIASIETSIWTMEWAIAELVNNPAIQEKLGEEMDEVVGVGNVVEESDICKLPYLQAVVKETLRLHMVAPFLLPHMNLKQAKLGGYDIPAQTKILINAWWMANDPALWDNPEEYRPERFLKSGMCEIDVSGADMRFFPFGVGRRSCPGMVVAVPLVSLVIARLVHFFHLSTPPGVHKLDMTEQCGQFTLRIANHFNILLKPRSSDKSC